MGGRVPGENHRLPEQDGGGVIKCSMNSRRKVDWTT
jgi:hypothetical protein